MKKLITDEEKEEFIDKEVVRIYNYFCLKNAKPFSVRYDADLFDYDLVFRIMVRCIHSQYFRSDDLWELTEDTTTWKNREFKNYIIKYKGKEN